MGPTAMRLTALQHSAPVPILGSLESRETQMRFLWMMMMMMMMRRLRGKVAVNHRRIAELRRLETVQSRKRVRCISISFFDSNRSHYLRAVKEKKTVEIEI